MRSVPGRRPRAPQTRRQKLRRRILLCFLATAAALLAMAVSCIIGRGPCSSFGLRQHLSSSSTPQQEQLSKSAVSLPAELKAAIDAQEDTFDMQPQVKASTEQPVVQDSAAQPEASQQVQTAMHAWPPAWTGSSGDYKITRELLQAYAVNNAVSWTIANAHYLEYALNWAHHVQKTGLDKFLVGAIDDEVLQALVERGVPCFAMSTGLPTHELGWGSKSFKKRGAEKIKVLIQILTLGFESFFTDVDTAWIRNPLPFFSKYPDADVFCSTDARGTKVPPDEEILEVGPAHHIGGMGYINTGIGYHKPTALQFAQEWHDRLVNASQHVMEQPMYNTVMLQHGVRPDPDRTDRLTLTYRNESLRVGFLPLRLFAHGRAFFVERLAKVDEPYVVHANYMFGYKAKRQRFREFGLWNQDPPEYYDSPGGYLHYSLDLPEAMRAASVPRYCTQGVCTNQSHLLLPEDLNGHFAMLNHQLLQMRSAFAVAQALGRALVMPPIWCALDHGIEPHQGIWGWGARMASMPWLCPTDHIFATDKFFSEEHGPPIDIRESVFLEHPKVPASVKESRVAVQICQDGEAGCCNDESCSVGNGVVKLQPNLTDVQLTAALKGLQDVRIMHFSSMLGTFGGFADPQAGEVFRHKTERLTVFWCCFVEDHVSKKRHRVWQDMWWDEVPHTNAVGQVWDVPWVPWPVGSGEPQQ